METSATPTITVEAIVQAPVEKVWNYWNNPENIMQWNAATDDWFCPKAENNLSVGKKFSYRMEAKDGSFGFDFEGEYTSIIEHSKIVYVMSDGRKVEIIFKPQGNATLVVETFDPENMNPVDMQKAGWQAILDSFKKHAESH